MDIIFYSIENNEQHIHLVGNKFLIPCDVFEFTDILFSHKFKEYFTFFSLFNICTPKIRNVLVICSLYKYIFFNRDLKYFGLRLRLRKLLKPDSYNINLQLINASYLLLKRIKLIYMFFFK